MHSRAGEGLASGSDYDRDAIMSLTPDIQTEMVLNEILEDGECTEEGERYSWILDDYPEHCCSGLTEWPSGMDTRKVENGQCVETGLQAGAPWGKCLNCGNGICEDIENVCNCPADCKKAAT